MGWAPGGILWSRIGMVQLIDKRNIRQSQCTTYCGSEVKALPADLWVLARPPVGFYKDEPLPPWGALRLTTECEVALRARTNPRIKADSAPGAPRR
jgi:hypothetical protein